MLHYLVYEPSAPLVIIRSTETSACPYLPSKHQVQVRLRHVTSPKAVTTEAKRTGGAEKEAELSLLSKTQNLLLISPQYKEKPKIDVISVLIIDINLRENIASINNHIATRLVRRSIAG